MRSEFDYLYDKQLLTRIKVAYFILIFIFGIICLRLWYLQIIGGAHYRKLSENNRIRIQKIKAPRGLILDSRGKVLATNRPCFDICLVPQDTNNPQLVLNRLADMLGVGLSQLKTRVESSKRRPPFEPIKLIPDASRDAVGLVLTHRLDLPGIIVSSIPVRYYPYGTLACHLLGHLGEISPQELKKPEFSQYKVGDFIGKYGVEQKMEFYFKGTDGGYQTVVDAKGYKISIVGKVDPIPAYNVVLTICVDLQKAAEEALGDRSGAVIAINPNNGQVMAMVSRPAFNPNLFARGISAQDWDNLVNNPGHPLLNRCIQGLHPPGSTYKLITSAAALEEGLVTPDTTFICKGFFKLGNRSYRCWRRSGHGEVDLMKGLIESCDVYFYNLGLLLGPDILARYAKNFGFGKPSGIDLLYEKSGFVPSSDWYRRRYGIPWQDGESLSIAIGQGSNQVTPLQLLIAYASIANGGLLYKPIYIDKIVNVEGRIIKRFKPIIMGRVNLSQSNIKFLKECLWGAVNSPSGTGWRSKLPDIDVAGKTGTAQVVSIKRESSLHQDQRFLDHAWFVGFAPKEDAQIAVVVLVEHGGHGGSTSAPIAKKIISKFFDLKEGGYV